MIYLPAPVPIHSAFVCYSGYSMPTTCCPHLLIQVHSSHYASFVPCASSVSHSLPRHSHQHGFFSFLKRQNINIFLPSVTSPFPVPFYVAKDLKRVVCLLADSALPFFLKSILTGMPYLSTGSVLSKDLPRC